MKLFVLFILSFFVSIFQLFLNQYTSQNGFVDLNFCFFFYCCIKIFSVDKSSWKTFFEWTCLSLILGFFCDVFSLNILGTAMLSFLILSCFFFVFFPFVIRFQFIEFYFFFALSSFFYQLITCLILIFFGDISFPSVHVSQLLSVSFLHAGMLSLVFSKKSF